MGKGELEGEKLKHGRGLGDAGWGRDRRESDGRENRVGR